MADTYTAKNASGVDITFSSKDIGGGVQEVRHGVPDGEDVTQGAKADARNAATDTTAITIMQVLKQISYMLQNPATIPALTAISNVVHVDDNSGALTVDGTVTANLSATDNAVLDALAAVLGDTTGVKVVSDTNGTIQQYLRGLVTLVADTTASAVSVADGADVALGLTTDAPGSSSVPEDTTARTTIAILKAIKNILILVNAKLVTGTDIGDVTINNASGAAAVNVQDGGNALTVDGTVTANLSATDNAVLDAAVAVLGDTTGAAVITDVNGTIQQYLRGLVKLWIAGLPAGSAAIGKLAANSGVDIGDVDVVTVMGKTAGQATMANSIPVAIASNQSALLNQPFAAMLEGGLTELVGINEQVDQNDYSGSVGVSLGASMSGEILAVALYATEDGTGAVQDSAGILYVFDADPSISSGDTAMSAAARVTCIGKIPVGAADWDVDANGGLAYITTQPIPYHAVSTLYFVWKHLDATGLNDAAGDDEQLEFNFWHRRES